MARKSTDRWALRISVASLLVAALGSASTFLYQKHAISQQEQQFLLLHSELVSIHLDRKAPGYFFVPGYNFGTLGVVLQIPLRLTVSNVGEQSLSITDYVLSSGTHAGAREYSGIQGKLLDRMNGSVTLPIDLSAGETKVFTAYIGYLVPGPVATLMSQLQGPGNIVPETLTEKLAENGMDLFGNSVKYERLSGGLSSITVDEGNQKAPTIWCELTTGRGKVFTVPFDYYGRPQ
jgi:hypothetical protein